MLIVTRYTVDRVYTVLDTDDSTEEELPAYKLAEAIEMGVQVVNARLSTILTNALSGGLKVRNVCMAKTEYISSIPFNVFIENKFIVFPKSDWAFCYQNDMLRIYTNDKCAVFKNVDRFYIDSCTPKCMKLLVYTGGSNCMNIIVSKDVVYDCNCFMASVFTERMSLQDFKRICVLR